MFEKSKKIVFIFISIFALIVAVVYAVFKSPSIQTLLTKKIANYIASELGTEIGIGGVDFRPFKTLVLEDFFILDLHQDTLLKTSRFYLDVDAFDRNTHRAVINKLQFENPMLNLKQYRNDTNFNVQFLFDYFHSDDSSSHWNTLINTIKIHNGKFRYINENSQLQETQGDLDYSNLYFNNINIQTNYLSIKEDSIRTEIQQFSLIEKCGFAVDSLSCMLQLIFGKVAINDLKLLTKNSSIAGNFSFKYNEKDDFNNFIENIYIKSNFNNSKINTSDIAFFTNEFINIDKKINLTGSFSGKVNNLKGKNLLVEFGDRSYLKGDLKLSGLPKIEETFIDLNIEKSQVTKKDLESYPMLIANAGKIILLPDNFSKLGLIKFSGRFTGFIYDFVAKALFKTAIGSFSSDLNMKINPEKNDAKYTGNISLRNFNIGTYLGINNIVDKISLTGKVEGRGLKFDNLVANINGHADEIALSNYTYRNCDINGTISRKLFNGQLSVNDENLNLNFSGNIDISQKIPQFDFTSEIKNADLVKQNIVDPTSYAYKKFGNLILNTSLNLKFSGQSIENIHGKAIIDNTILITNLASHRISNINLIAGKLENGNKEMVISSEIADAQINGKFEMESIQNSFKLFLKSYLPSVFRDTIPASKEFQNYTFEINMKNPYLFNELVIPLFEKELNFRIPEDSYVKGYFDEKNRDFKLESIIKKMSYKDFETENLNINIRTMNDSLLITTSFDKLSSPKFGLDITKAHAAIINNGFYIKSTAMKDTVALFHVNTKGSFYKDTIMLMELLPSWVRLAGKNWHSDPFNSINFSNSVIDFNNIVLSNNKQQISINGTVSDNLNEQINIELVNFDIENLNEIFELDASSRLGGTANGNLDFSGLKINPQFKGDLYVKNLSFSSNHLGDGNMHLSWSKNENKLFLNSSIKYEEITTFFLNGFYSIAQKNLDFDFNLSPVPIHVFDKILLPYVSDLSGNFSSQIKITGTAENPDLKGFVKLDDAECTVNYLQTHYQVTDLIQIDGNKFIFKEVDIFDKNHNKCLANGYLSHVLFDEFEINMELDSRNFQFLNTKEKDNTMYYGSGIATGKVIFKGPVETPQIKIIATTEPGTKIFIPISDETELSEQKFVSFVQNKSSVDSSAKNEVTLSGINMDFQLEVTPDAEVQLIFDPTIGDIVKCYGNANLRMEINTLGYFNMYGNYTLEKGDYLFTFKDVINKRFKVEQGGTIQWNGDPYDAKIKLDAIYKLRTQLMALMENNENMLEEEYNAYKKRVPIECLLKMTGALQSPDINFEIICKDNIPDLAKLELQSLQNDQLEMNKQIFGLLALNRFLPKQSFDLSRGNAIGSNARELLSNQISNWVSHYRDDIDLGIYYHGQDSLSDFITSRELQIALTKRFFNDRLSVNIDGNFELGNTGAPVNNDDKKYIIGDFTVEYKLSKDGRFRVKSFHKTYNDILGYNYTTKQGIGLFYKKEYDSIADLRKVMKKSTP